MTTYPIAEVFHSLQGEGYWTGTPMMFIRLAGCTVGQYAQVDAHLDVHMPLDFPLYQAKKHSVCTTADGQRFLCDTDYHRFTNLTILELIAALSGGGEEHVCITGGEPLMHDLQPLVQALEADSVHVHIETSGTLVLPPLRGEDAAPLWFTVCPKKGFRKEWLRHADEFKFLVGPDFDEVTFEQFLEVAATDQIYLQPINGVTTPDKENILRCLKLLKKYPQCRLSAQLHKYLGLR